jgi:hypothetical protein
MNEMTLCLWTSVNNSSPVILSMVIKNAGMNTRVTLAKIINITRYTTNIFYVH